MLHAQQKKEKKYFKMALEKAATKTQQRLKIHGADTLEINDFALNYLCVQLTNWSSKSPTFFSQTVEMP